MTSDRQPAKLRIAFVVSHPVQYYVPLYQRLARREDIVVRVFYTWHDGHEPVGDSGFGHPVKWDVPMTEGYDHVLVPNRAARPGTHHFAGLRNPTLVERVLAWQPHVVHVTGYAWLSHLLSLRALHRSGIPVLFRGDSHLLDERQCGPRWWLKRAVLRKVFSWPTACLYVGEANKAYYEAFGVAPERLRYCPHSIDTGRFSSPERELEREASAWRTQLGLGADRLVLLFAGKFHPNKRPLELMRAVLERTPRGVALVLVGDGELRNEVSALAACGASRFRVLPFQNQSRMPLVYRIGDICVLPSGAAETWGLAVNEALACGRPAIASDAVGCAPDLLGDGECGWRFPVDEWDAFGRVVAGAESDRARVRSMGVAARHRSRQFDIAATESSLLDVMHQLDLVPSQRAPAWQRRAR